MDISERLKLLSTTAVVSLAAAALIAPAAAQDSDEPDELEEIVEEDELAEGETIVITGSRLRRDTFNSAAPLQIIDGQVARESGLFDVQEILSASPQVTGSQVDQAFVGFVLDQGPGSAEVNFRGLGSGRTLVLVNGKRLAPAGVEGAPTAPDVSLIPRILIDRIENLLDGASSVYGSDAVAGVSNIILRSDFDGLRLEGTFSQPENGGGEVQTIAASWGAQADKGYIGFGIEYTKRENLTFGDRDFLTCTENREIGQDSGLIRSLDISNAPGVSTNDCQFAFFNRINIGDGIFGNVYRNPDGVSSNIGIPGFSESGVNPFFQVFRPDVILDNGSIDADGDGLQDIDFFNPYNFFAGSPADLQRDFLPTNELLSFFSYGEYELNPGMTAYFEAFYNNRQTFIDRGTIGLGATYSGDSPFNPCNRFTNPDGVDCYLFFGLGPDANGPEAPEVTPNIQLKGLNFQEIEVSQTRIVGGLKGELPFLNTGAMRDWQYDVYAMISRSSGQSNRPAIINDRLVLSVDTAQRLPDGSVVCGVDFDGDGLPDLGNDPTNQAIEPCVPVNLFAPEKFGFEGGTLTPAEYDYLVGNRLFNTIFEQTVVSGFVSGVAGVLPWNSEDVNLGFGFEYREDRIRSDPGFVGQRGQQFNFFTDPGASGSRDLYELFFEAQTDLIKDAPFAQLLSVEFAARWTEESTYGSAWTYSGKGFYQPTDWLTVRGTYGTSFRAPNAREQFLRQTSGFNLIEDPCVVPDAARDASPVFGDPEIYNASNDTRSPDLLALCVGNGVDPTSLGLDPAQDFDYTTEIISGGSQDVAAETSRSWTAGVVFEPLLAAETLFGVEAFQNTGLRLSATYFDILVEDSIQELSFQNIVDECLDLDGGTTCGRFSRDANGLIDFIDTSPVNIGSLTSVGVDFNMLLTHDFEIAGQSIGLSLDGAASWLLEQEVEQLGAVDDNAGETESPDWTMRANLLMDWENWRLNWFTRYIQGGEENETSFGAGVTCTPDPSNPSAPQINELCRAVYFTTDYWVHNASISYAADTWTFNAGVRNVFDREPELVDPQGVSLSIRNVPLGVGYDVYGRTFFVNLAKSF